MVRSVRGDLAPDALGVTDAHDHLLLASPAILGMPLDDEHAAIGEAREFQAAGDRPRRCMLARTLEVDDLAALFVEELTEGMRRDDGTAPNSNPVRAGVIKVAAGYHDLDQHERTGLAAAGAAHQATGAPVCVHLELGTHGPGGTAESFLERADRAAHQSRQLPGRRRLQPLRATPSDHRVAQLLPT